MAEDLQPELRAIRARLDQLVERFGPLEQERGDASEGRDILVGLIERWTKAVEQLKASTDAQGGAQARVEAKVEAQAAQLERAVVALEARAKAIEARSNAWVGILKHPIVQQALSLLLMGLVAWLLLRMDVWQIVAPS